MSYSPSWHHRPGEFCFDPKRVWRNDKTGEIDEGPWPAELTLSEMPKTEGHWICPGHTGFGLGSGPGA